MLATAKHFPGHGDVAQDSHLELPVLSVDRARLDSVELPPFRAAIDAGVATVMSAHKGSIDLTKQQTELLKQLSAINKPFVFALFGSPYLLHHIPELPSYMLTYDIHPGAEMAAVKAIAGEIPVQGKLPISLPGLYPVGHGLQR